MTDFRKMTVNLSSRNHVEKDELGLGCEMKELEDFSERGFVESSERDATPIARQLRVGAGWMVARSTSVATEKK